MGPSVSSQQEVNAPSLPVATLHTSRHLGERPREAPLEANAVTVALVSPAVSQSVTPPVPLTAQPVTDSMFAAAGVDAR